MNGVMLYQWTLIVVLLWLSYGNSLKILGVFPFPGKSHGYVFLPLVKGLSDKGHEVTVISHFTPNNKTNDEIRHIKLSAPILMNYFDLDQLTSSRLNRWMSVHKSRTMGHKHCDSGLNDPEFVDFLKTDHTSFDVIIAEFFNTDCFLGLIHKYKAPLIGISSSAIFHWHNDLFGNPRNPSYVPINTFVASDRLTFLERLENTVVGFGQQVYYDHIMVPEQDAMARKYFGNDMPYLKDIMMNSSLFLTNNHFSLNTPKPTAPAVVDVGGIHILKGATLPKDLEKWISEAPHGVIYFSLGSMIRGHTFPENLRNEFLKAFARLPQRVLWKWENDSMPGQPDNVKIGKWMPQFDVLSHPNVRAFISHGGLLGTTEAVHCGVPVVVMPQYGDQHTNARALEANGGGVILQLREATEEKVYNALQKVLAPEFRKGAQELSARFRDRPLPPLETAIYWVEYVARHRGAHHMRTAAVDMPLYQYLLLDVFAFLALVALVLSLISFYVTRTVFRFVFKSKKPKVKTN